MISEKIIERVLNQTDLVDLIGSTVTLKKKGASYWACCPLHGEKTPSFQVRPGMNLWYCHGCHKGGNAITWLMETDHVSFPEAVRMLARGQGIDIPEEEPTADERRAHRHKEALYVLNASVAEYFREQLYADENERARQYVERRWAMEYAVSVGIGYAPTGWDNLIKVAEEKGWNVDLMLELGLVKKSEKTGKLYDFYRGRVMIPIYDKMGRVIGFSGRDIICDNPDIPKYLNSSESAIYSKGLSLFGINYAFKEASRKDKMYIVEGGPDVLRMHCIKVENTVASLGTGFTDEQFKQILRLTTNICFIPDCDPVKGGETFAAGVSAVMKNGRAALRHGFNVLVREIPTSEDGSKNDPDSYFKTIHDFKILEEEEFILWYAKKVLAGKEQTAEIIEAAKDICSLVVLLQDQLTQDVYLGKLVKVLPDKNVWNRCIKFVRDSVRQEARKKSEKDKGYDLYEKYGFMVQNGGYCSLGKEGNVVEWSNFTMTPMFHIRDAVSPKRMYKLVNSFGYTEIIELKQDDLCSLARFRARIEGLGNFIWEAKEEHLTKLKRYLYEQTETATEITQLGWQREEFFAWGNGVFADNQFQKADEYGIVRLGEKGNFYLPACSSIYAREKMLFQYERNFVHENFQNITLREVAEKMVALWGGNAQVGICFLLATLFRDVITGHTRTFPVLNLFGPKGTGKSELGHTLMSFFIIKNKPANLENTTKAAFGAAVGACANALVHLDEFKNTVPIEIRELLKGLWDGVGRSRMNMDKDKKTEMTAVDAGVIVSGQEMATADIALFTRYIYLTFSRSSFTETERRQFREIVAIRDHGLSHLTNKILSYRAQMEAGFASMYKMVSADLQQELSGISYIDRIFGNWLIPLAAFRVLEPYLDLPFTYAELLKTFATGITFQNNECAQNDEVAGFWQVVQFLCQEGELTAESDYKIKVMTDLKTKTGDFQWQQPKSILMLRPSRVFMLYKKNGRAVGDNVLPEGSLKYYLEHSNEYLGKKQSERFKNIIKGREQTVNVTTSMGTTETKVTSTVDHPLCFDHDYIKAKYGINLEVGFEEEETQYSF